MLTLAPPLIVSMCIYVTSPQRWTQRLHFLEKTASSIFVLCPSTSLPQMTEEGRFFFVFFPGLTQLLQPKGEAVSRGDKRSKNCVLTRGLQILTPVPSDVQTKTFTSAGRNLESGYFTNPGRKLASASKQGGRSPMTEMRAYRG